MVVMISLTVGSYRLYRHSLIIIPYSGGSTQNPGALLSDGEKKTTKTNNYGDFEFEGLPEDKEYSIKIEHPGYKAQEFSVRTKTDVYLGDVILT